MKAIKIFAASLAIVSLVACKGNKPAGQADGADSTGVAQIPAQGSENPKDFLPSKGLTDSTSYLLGCQLGGMMKQYNFGGDVNWSMVKKGIMDFINSKGSPRDSTWEKQFKISPNEVQRIFSDFLEKRNAYTQAVNKAEEVRFLAANKSKAGVEVTESGLQYIIEEAGDAEKPGPRDTVFVHYKLSLKDGTVIEEVKPEAQSIELTLDRVIPGWTEGIQLFGIGGKGKLFVPSELGYGDRGSNGIEPNTTLIFDIQIDSLRRYAEPTEKTK